MLGTKEIKKLIGNEDMSDEEAKEIRGACYALVELALELFCKEKAPQARDARDGELHANSLKRDEQTILSYEEAKTQNRM